MPSIRNIALSLMASLAMTSFTSAVETYNQPPVEVVPVPVLCANVHTQITPVIAEITRTSSHLFLSFCSDALATVDIDTLTPLVANIKATIDSATAKVQAMVDAQIDVDVLLSADVNGGATVSIGDLAVSIAAMVEDVLGGCKSVFSLAAQADVDIVVCTKIVASLCVSIALFLQACCALFVDLSAALSIQLTAFVAFCLHLGVDASVFAFLNIAL
ncbi:hypothetical protein L218DRAFT_1052319 [Marasmius fiardii PR-910]|nr:hypothetical protein L218DRAFT_1052319 [Marasmius fiardii PR-910]